MPTSNYTIKSRPGKAAIISMKSDGYPYPNYTWTHNGEVIHSDMQYDDGPCSFINISSVTIPDFGEYTLTMSNYLGSYVSHLSLIPYGKRIYKYNGDLICIVLVQFAYLWRYPRHDLYTDSVQIRKSTHTTETSTKLFLFRVTNWNDQLTLSIAPYSQVVFCRIIHCPE